MSLIHPFHNQEAITVRPSYTAEFLISSDDRLPTDPNTPTVATDSSSTSFTLGGGVAIRQGAKTSNGYAVAYGGPVSLYNGQFNRLSLTELDMWWGVENISGQLWGNNELTVIASVGGGAYNYYDIEVPAGFYNVSQMLQQVVFELNTAIGTSEFYIIPPGGYVNGSSLVGSGQCLLAMKSAGSLFSVQSTSPLAQALSLPSNLYSQSLAVVRPNLIPIDYVDFVCRQLTDNMSLRDGSTSATGQGTPVLSRWYFAPDTDQYDQYGFKILQGYTPFSARRPFAYPKQMRWDPKQPIGQLSFEVRVPTNWRPSDANYSTYYYTNPPLQGLGTVLDLNLVYNETDSDQNPYTDSIFGFQMKLLVSEQ